MYPLSLRNGIVVRMDSIKRDFSKKRNDDAQKLLISTSFIFINRSKQKIIRYCHTEMTGERRKGGEVAKKKTEKDLCKHIIS